MIYPIFPMEVLLVAWRVFWVGLFLSLLAWLLYELIIRVRSR